MRIKKKHIQEKINPDVVAKQTRSVVDAVKGELKSDDDTAVEFIKGMTGGNVSEDGDRHTNAHKENMKKREIFFEGLRIGNETNPDTFRGNLSGNRIAISAWDEFCARNRDMVSEDDNERAGRAIDYGTKEPELGVQVDRNMPKTGGIDFDEKDGEPDLPFEGKKDEKVVEGRKVLKTITIKEFKK
tara:strand:+ start:20221 stop:20778 length:558 start_codon:yes stop_codon:yes gene_type:complete